MRTLFAILITLLATSVSADDLSDLQSKVDSWVSKSKEIYRLDCDDMKEIWMAYCANYDVTQERDREEASKVAEKMKDSAKGGIEPLLSQYDDLKNQAEKLSTGETKFAADKILETIKTEKERLERLKNGAWLGSNNPLIQYAIRYGQDKHKDMGGSSDYDCDVVDRSFPSIDGRPDCVSAKRCRVFEFKPDNDRAKGKGNEQLNSSPNYVAAVNKYYSEMITRKETPNSDLGGSDIIKKIHENKSCYSGEWPAGGDPAGEIQTKFVGEVRTYRPCENTYECVSR